MANLHFDSNQEKSSFFRSLRLIHDDLCSYASSAGPYCALNDHAENSPVIAALNQHAVFWNCMLASLQTTAFISLGRLHAKARGHKHLESFIKSMASQNSDCRTAIALLKTAIAKQEPFIKRSLNLRHKLFAHTDFDAPLVAVFGFEGIEVADFRAYWEDIMSAMEACDFAMFGVNEHGPKFEKKVFAEIEVKTANYLHAQSR